VSTSLFLALAFASSLLAQQRLGPMAESGRENLPGQKLGPNDLVAVSVYDAPELTRTVRVSGGGTIRLPMVKEPVEAAGLLPSELEISIANILKEEGILVDPIVSVTVAEYHSRPISVMGAVKRPTTFQAAGPVTLLEALGRAEGLSGDAGPEIVLSPPLRPDGTRPLPRRIPVRELIDEARPELNVMLTGGEEIRVPEAKKIYVAGNVKRPGAIQVREGSPVTVLKAVSMAEGLSPFYKKTVYILRPNDDGTKREIAVDLSRILKNVREDVPLEPDDILYVPDDSGKRTTMNIIDRATTFSLGTISGVLVWRR
jgi:polysaccharide export outer membrane protein